MKLLNYNAATHLFERVKSLENEPHDSWKAIHICLAGKGEYTSALRMHFFVQPLRDMLVDKEGYIYVMEDGDIFILFQGQLKPVMEMLHTRFADIKDDVEEGLFTVYDLSRYWQLFYDLCEHQVKTVMQSHLQQAHRPAEVMFRTTTHEVTS
jgi:hypothetical protein